MADDDSRVDNGRINGVEAQHKLPTQINTEDSDAVRDARALLREVGFNAIAGREVELFKDQHEKGNSDRCFAGAMSEPRGNA